MACPRLAVLEEIRYPDKMHLPLAHLPLLRTRTLEEASRLFHQFYGSAQFETSSKNGEFRWDANGVALGGMHVIVGTIHERVSIFTKSGIDATVLVLGRQGTGVVRHNGKEVLLSDKRGVVITPAREADLFYHRRFDTLTVRFESSVLTDAMYALTGIRSAKTLEFEPSFDKTSVSGSELFRLLEFILRTFEQDGSPLAHPVVLSNLQNAFVNAFLHAQPHNHSQLLENGAPTPSMRAVKVAEEYLDAHAAEAITMTELQSVTGMSVRSLQEGFRAKRGCSPMQFLRERRLLLAQQRLKNAKLGTKVAEVAYSCGFAHLGRFSHEYAKRFGEKPSETLERALVDLRGSAK